MVCQWTAWETSESGAYKNLGTNGGESVSGGLLGDSQDFRAGGKGSLGKKIKAKDRRPIKQQTPRTFMNGVGF